MKKQFPHVNGLYDTLNVSKWCYPTESNKLFIQFHFDQCNHWILSSSLNGQVRIYDSTFSDFTTKALKEEICYVYKKFATSGELKITYDSCQKQEKGTDCGLFCMANAWEVINGTHPSEASFDQRSMRTHLELCYEQNQFSQFPQDFTINIKRKAEVVRFIHICSNCERVIHDEVKDCDLCIRKFHKNCLTHSICYNCAPQNT